jgi:hypothetical protein
MPNDLETDQKAQWTGKQPIIKRTFFVTIQSYNCLKCLKLIEVIHQLNKSMNRIESHHHSDYDLLRNVTKSAMSEMLDIIARLK